LRLGAITPTGQPATTGPFNRASSRYIYTMAGGWVDMVHFLFYGGAAYANKLAGVANPVGEAMQSGYLQEFSDRLRAPWSAYNYEDLPSDRYGAIFGAQFFDPTSPLTLAQQVQAFMSQMKATNPENAPNWDSLPETDTTQPPRARNTTTRPMFITPGNAPLGTQTAIENLRQWCASNRNSPECRP
jgi:hypothetical protein